MSSSLLLQGNASRIMWKSEIFVLKHVDAFSLGLYSTAFASCSHVELNLAVVYSDKHYASSFAAS